MSSCWDIHHLRNFNAKLWRKFHVTEGSTNERTNKRTNEHTNIRTERRKLYTPRHKCRGYNQRDSDIKTSNQHAAANTVNQLIFVRDLSSRFSKERENCKNKLQWKCPYRHTVHCFCIVQFCNPQKNKLPRKNVHETKDAKIKAAKKNWVYSMLQAWKTWLCNFENQIREQ